LGKEPVQEPGPVDAAVDRARDVPAAFSWKIAPLSGSAASGGRVGAASAGPISQLALEPDAWARFALAARRELFPRLSFPQHFAASHSDSGKQRPPGARASEERAFEPSGRVRRVVPRALGAAKLHDSAKSEPGRAPIRVADCVSSRQPLAPRAGSDPADAALQFRPNGLALPEPCAAARAQSADLGFAPGGAELLPDDPFVKEAFSASADPDSRAALRPNAAKSELFPLRPGQLRCACAALDHAVAAIAFRFLALEHIQDSNAVPAGAAFSAAEFGEAGPAIHSLAADAACGSFPKRLAADALADLYAQPAVRPDSARARPEQDAFAAGPEQIA